MGLKAVSSGLSNPVFGGYYATGLAADGVTDDTVALQAALDSVSAKGGTVILPAGTILISSTINITKKCTIAGQGGSESLGNPCTRIVISSATLDAISVNVSGVSMRDFMVQNVLGLNGAFQSATGNQRIYNTTQVPTAGSGIRYTNLNSGQLNPQSGDLIHLTRMTAQGFWNNFQFDAGYYYTITDCHSFDPANYGIYLNNLSSDGADHGDFSIIGTTISMIQSQRSAAGALRWESGGGIRIANCKINGKEQPAFPASYSGQTGSSGQTIGTCGTFVIGIYCGIGENQNISTIDCNITNNSIENCSSIGIAVVHGDPQATNTSTFGNVIVTGNEIGIGMPQGIVIGPNHVSNSTVWHNVVVSNNILNNVSSSGVNLFNIVGGTISGNVFAYFSGTSPLGTAISLTGAFGCFDINIDNSNVYMGDSNTLFNYFKAGQALSSSYAGLGLSQTRYKFEREIPTYTVGTKKILYSYTFPQFSAGTIDFYISGNLNTVGAQVTKASYTFTTDISTGQVLLTQIGTTAGTDVNAMTAGASPTGTNYTIFLDTTTTNGKLIISLDVTAAGKTTFWGIVAVDVFGQITTAKKGS